MNKFVAYIKDESGQTSTEYILLVAVAAAIVLRFKKAITNQLLGDDDSGSGGLLGTVMGKVTDSVNTDL